MSIVDIFSVGPADLALFVVAGFFGFFVSTVVGIGGTMILIPVLLFRVPAAEAIAVVSPVMLVNNVLKLAALKEHADKKAATWVMLTALPAAAVGAFYAGSVDERLLKTAIAMLIASALLFGRTRTDDKIGKRGVMAFGVSIGAASGLCGAGGAPTAICMRSYGLEKEAFVGTIAALAIGLQLAKIPSYGAAGLYSIDRLGLALALCVASALAVFAGKRVLFALDVKRFRQALTFVLAALAVSLLYSAWG